MFLRNEPNARQDYVKIWIHIYNVIFYVFNVCRFSMSFLQNLMIFHWNLKSTEFFPTLIPK